MRSDRRICHEYAQRMTVGIFSLIPVLSTTAIAFFVWLRAIASVISLLFNLPDSALNRTV